MYVWCRSPRLANGQKRGQFPKNYQFLYFSLFFHKNFGIKLGMRENSESDVFHKRRRTQLKDLSTKCWIWVKFSDTKYWVKLEQISWNIWNKVDNVCNNQRIQVVSTLDLCYLHINVYTLCRGHCAALFFTMQGPIFWRHVFFLWHLLGQFL